MAQKVKNPPARRETWVGSLADPLEEGMSAHSRVLSWRTVARKGHSESERWSLVI